MVRSRDEEWSHGAAGVSLWRQVSDGLAADIEAGRLKVDERLPPAAVLAKRFKVNRHTVLKAITHLQSEGLLRMERGRGSYAVVNPVAFRLGPRQWFEQNLLESNRTPSRAILAVEEIPASAEVAGALQIDPGDPVVFVTTLGEADGVPVNLGYHHFPAERLAGIAEAFRATAAALRRSFSFDEILKSVGVTDWRRKSIRIRGRNPNRDEAAHLKIAPSDVLLITVVISTDSNGVPVVYAKTGYGGSRTELVVDL